ncbi:hypothetical protein PIB30_008553 [Stylosanthes scabra]|uniref:Uncharacterized protein n=1 Tax=Stylosanthes scabra TaxID=79078 RepID=A0ABU6Q4U8_9FABA|nr:hypothetical protein [Stylosanthes scabra]
MSHRPSSHTIQAHCKYFYWLDRLIEKNAEEYGTAGTTFSCPLQIFLGGLKPDVGMSKKTCRSFELAVFAVEDLTINCFILNLARGGGAGGVEGATNEFGVAVASCESVAN